MNEERGMFVESVARMLRDHATQKALEAAKAAGWSEPVWRVLAEAGVPLLGVPEASGGAGGTVADAAAILRVAGANAAPVPLAETMLAGWLLSASGLPVPAGPLTVGPVRRGDALTLARSGGGWTLSGTAKRVPFAARAARLVVIASDGTRDHVALVDPRACRIAAGSNLAYDARDTVEFPGVALRADEVVPAGPGVSFETLYLRGAVARAVQMTGALDRCLELSIGHAKTRIQFGRPIAKFQAIQQEIARLGGEVAASAAAALSAASAVDAGDAGADAMASAKIRCGEAALAGAAIAHQVHGAIGVTQEYELHFSTLRLAAWRSEFGAEAEWAGWLGRRVRARGADAFWPALTAS
jgi:alkylation response protein AidB-like acyl-CoA dehydrogenase